MRGHGGQLADHNRQRFADYRDSKTRVELRGPCYSACTLITAYVSKADLCIAEGAFFAFHAVRSMERKELMPAETARMYWQQTEQIRAGSTATAAGKTCRSTATGRCTIASCGRWATRNACEVHVMPYDPRMLQMAQQGVRMMAPQQAYAVCAMRHSSPAAVVGAAVAVWPIGQSAR